MVQTVEAVAAEYFPASHLSHERERVSFIGTQFSNLYTVLTPAVVLYLPKGSRHFEPQFGVVAEKTIARSLSSNHSLRASTVHASTEVGM